MVGTCQGPLTIIARFPEMNWFIVSPWVQLMTSLGIAPLFTRSRTRDRALIPFALSIWNEVFPEPHSQHRNPKVPSSFWTELMPKPCTFPLVVFKATLFSSSQVFGGLQFAAFSM